MWMITYNNKEGKEGTSKTEEYICTYKPIKVVYMSTYMQISNKREREANNS